MFALCFVSSIEDDTSFAGCVSSKTLLPSNTASAKHDSNVLTERIASSLPGTGYLMGSGLAFVSTTPTTGIPKLFASFTDKTSLLTSIIHKTDGSLFIETIPPSVFSIFCLILTNFKISFFVY